LSDATNPNGLLSNPIFENIDYDLLTIGNHELYVTDIAYEHFNQFAKVYGEKYLTSNVEIINPATGKFEYIGQQFRYFTTKQGLRIMAFGVLYDFTGNSNVSRITKAASMVTQSWFTQAVNYSQPVDLFMVIGHNPIRTNVSSSTLGLVYQAIRKIKPNTPIQMFGGHTHIRDFFVYDNKAVGLEAGRYCETLGWLSISGFNSTSYKAKTPTGIPSPTRAAVVVQTGPAAANLSLSNTTSSLRYARRYLDWNRLTFEYHANGSQTSKFDTQTGVAATAQISAIRKQLNLTSVYGCAPQSWCMSCAPFGSSTNIYTLLSDALSTVVINQTRSSNPRLILINTGSIRFDLPQGPFTYDDSFIVSPFTDAFQFIPDVPYANAMVSLYQINYYEVCIWLTAVCRKYSEF
jgi:2',3'-cyclic-nucleotide 2'-phosphodiesterase (5'-nucleotidase family)